MASAMSDASSTGAGSCARMAGATNHMAIIRTPIKARMTVKYTGSWVVGQFGIWGKNRGQTLISVRQIAVDLFFCRGKLGSDPDFSPRFQTDPLPKAAFESCV